MPRQTRPRRSLLVPLLIVTAPLPVALSAGPAIAQAMLDDARALRVGQYLWDEGGVTAPGALSITVNVAQQRLYIYRRGQLIGISTVSTGMKGHSTPLGDFTILQKDMWHRSNIYSNAPMPYMQRLTWTGIALHAGHLPGYPASHGCIRLPLAFAKRLFGITTLGVPVTIVGANRQPLVKLQFADIEWLTSDDRVMASPAMAAPAPMPVPVEAPLPVQPRRQTPAPIQALPRPTLPQPRPMIQPLPPSQPHVQPIARPTPRPGVARTPNLIDERVLPTSATTRSDGPHWVDSAEIEAVRNGRGKPRLEFEPVPQ